MVSNFGFGTWDLDDTKYTQSNGLELKVHRKAARAVVSRQVTLDGLEAVQTLVQSPLEEEHFAS